MADPKEANSASCRAPGRRDRATGGDTRTRPASWSALEVTLRTSDLPMPASPATTANRYCNAANSSSASWRPTKKGAGRSRETGAAADAEASTSVDDAASSRLNLRRRHDRTHEATTTSSDETNQTSAFSLSHATDRTDEAPHDRGGDFVRRQHTPPSTSRRPEPGATGPRPQPALMRPQRMAPLGDVPRDLGEDETLDDGNVASPSSRG